MSSLGLNSALHLQLQEIARLVDQSIVEQNAPPTGAVLPGTSELSVLLRTAAEARPGTPAALLLATVVAEDPTAPSPAELATLLGGNDRQASLTGLERLATKLESVRAEVMARMLPR